MLKPAKTMDAILMATSIYFAAALKARLIEYHENTWTMIMLLSVTLCWFKVEHFAAVYKKDHPDSEDLSMPILFETISVISTTLSFLVIQFFIATIDGLIIEQHLFMEAVVFPALMLLFCILLVTITKKLQHKYEQVTR